MSEKRFWFYDDWEGGWIKASDERGYHTFVIPLGKKRAMIIAYRAGWKKFKHCEDCAQARKQNNEFLQDVYYVQTYWNAADIEDVLDMVEVDDEQWDEALGVKRV